MELDPVTFTLNKMTITQDLLNDVLNSLLHTVLYHRALGTVFVNFKQCSKLPNTTYMHCGDDSVNDSVKGLIKIIEKDFKTQGEKNMSGQIKISFKNQEKAKYLSFLDKKPAKVFERWILPIEIKKDSVNIQQIENDIQSTIFQIVDFANKNYDHIDESYMAKSKDKIVVFPFETDWIPQGSQSQSRV